MELETELWREAGKLAPFEESFPRLATLLAWAVPLQQLVVRRVEQNPARLSSVAAHPATAEAGRVFSLDLSTSQARALVAWAKTGKAAQLDDVTALTDLVPERGEQAALVAPLSLHGELHAVVIAILKQRAQVETSHLQSFEQALGPLAAAYENSERAHELSRLREALEADREALRMQRQEISDAVIGETGGLRNVMERVELVARTDAPVLILGETGSGKEVIARAIHARSRRHEGPVVRVNCGAIPAELVDSELFGHEKGSFTGAVAARQGWFERADGGTLFLDEVGELSLAAQVRLLRVLQDGSLERVGAQKTLHVDVRVVAATHRHLESMVAERTFREDLWYRLSVFPIRLPALRERMQDIPAFAAHFSAHAGHRVGTSALKPTPEDIALLEAYAWPGNVRELAAVIERAAILGNGRRLEVALALGSSTASGPGSPTRALADPDGNATGPIATLDQAIATHIERALVATHGRIEGRFGAARLLALNPHTLRAKMRKLKIDWSRFRQDSLAPPMLSAAPPLARRQ